MPAARDRGLAYALWWLAAVLVLPVADILVVVVVNALGLELAITIGWLPGLVAAAALNVGLLWWWGRRIGVSGGVVATAVAVSFTVAVLAAVILAIAVIAPALS